MTTTQQTRLDEREVQPRAVAVGDPVTLFGGACLAPVKPGAARGSVAHLRQTGQMKPRLPGGRAGAVRLVAAIILALVWCPPSRFPLCSNGHPCTFRRPAHSHGVINSREWIPVPLKRACLLFCSSRTDGWRRRTADEYGRGARAPPKLRACPKRPGQASARVWKGSEKISFERDKVAGACRMRLRTNFVWSPHCEPPPPPPSFTLWCCTLESLQYSNKPGFDTRKYAPALLLRQMPQPQPRL